MKSIRVIVVALGLIGYFVLFFSTRLADIERVTRQPWPRFAFFQFLLLPDLLAQWWAGSPPQPALADRLPVALLAAGILVVSGVAGWLILRATRWAGRFTRLERMVYSLAVGLSVVSTCVLLAGLAGWLYRSLFLGAAAAVLAVAARRLLRHRTDFSPFKRTKKTGGSLSAQRPTHGVKRAPSAQRPTHGVKPVLGEDAPKPILLRWLAWLILPFGVVILLGAMLPPDEFDVLEYHLQAPKEFYQAGRVTFLPHNVYANMPLGAEMLSLLAMVLAGDWWWGALAGKTVTACFVPLTGLAIFCAGRRLASPLAGVVGALVYVSTGWMVYEATLGLIDGVLAFYLFLTVDAAILLRKTPWGADPKADFFHSTLAGFLAGSAAAVKYPGLLFGVTPLIAWTAWQCWNQRGRMPWRRWLGPLAAVLLAAGVACGPWLVKNAVLAGNPTYPLLYEVFGGESRNAEKDAQWSRVHRPHDFRPVTLAGDLAQVGLWSDWLSPLLFPLAAMAFLIPSQRRTAWTLAGYFALVIAAWWLFTHRIDRFWIPALPVVALLAGVGATWSPGRGWRAALAGMVLVGSLFNLLVATSGACGYNSYLISLESLRVSPERVDPWHLALNREAASGKVVAVGDADVFDLTMPVVYATCFDTNWLETQAAGKTPQEVGQALRAAGVTHVYVDWYEIARYRKPGNYGFTPFFQPAWFDQLVAAGVLAPLPLLPDSLGRAYRVLPRAVQREPFRADRHFDPCEPPLPTAP